MIRRAEPTVTLYAEETELHAVFEYLGPSVSGRKANMTHTTIRKKIIAGSKNANKRSRVANVLVIADANLTVRTSRSILCSRGYKAEVRQDLAFDFSFLVSF